jgi:hypothetical protein
VLVGGYREQNNCQKRHQRQPMSGYDPERTYPALSVATAGVLKTAMSPLFGLPAVCSKLRGRHEGAEARKHRFIAPLT